MKPRVLVLRTAGTNCDLETAYAFELAGAEVERVHLSRLIDDPAKLRDYQILAFAGGFSYGDDIAAGKILANQLMHHLGEPLREFIAAKKPVLGVCNGFQVLVKTDLLPGGRPGQQAATLTHNDSGRFIDRWIRVKPVSEKCIWTAGLSPMDLPVAHGEGKFVPADEAARRALVDGDQIALVYVKADDSPAGGVFPDNPNGSEGDIAGVCDATGLVLGLMPHPERFVSKLQHPAWTSRPQMADEGAGLAVFRNAVGYVVET